MFAASFCWFKFCAASWTGVMAAQAAKRQKVDPVLPKESEWMKTDAAAFAESVETYVWC